MKNACQKFLRLCLLLILSVLLRADSVQASTRVDSDITEDTTWNLEGSPYDISTDIFISEDKTLTVEEGVIIKFERDIKINVSGVLNAIGSESEKIFFTSYTDDTVGGDEDGAPDTTGNMYDYTGIRLYAGGSINISNAVIKYSSLGIYGDDGAVNISNNTFSTNGYGVNMEGGEVTVANSVFENGVIPIDYDINSGIAFTHSGNTFSNNENNGIYIDNGVILDEFVLGGDDDYALGGYLYVGNDGTLIISAGVNIKKPEEVRRAGLDCDGGVLNIMGALSQRVVLDNIDIDLYRGCVGNMTNTDMNGGIINVYLGGSTLTANNLVMNEPRDDAIAVYVNASMSLSNSQILNTRYRDDAVAVFNNATFTMDNTLIDGGLYGIDAFNHAVVTVTDSVIKNISDSAITGYGRPEEYASNEIGVTRTEISDSYIGIFPMGNTTIDIYEDSIHDNFYGAYNYMSTVYDLRNNWWGDISGPYEPTLNPDGLGDAIYSDYVGNILFEPWLTRDPLRTYRTPVLIVPGVLGTEILKPSEEGAGDPTKLWLDIVRTLTDIGDEFMDPLLFNNDLTPTDTSLEVGEVIKNKEITIGSRNVDVFNYTKKLFEELTEQGYVEGQDIFTLPYDWRYGVNSTNVSLLKSKIDEIISETGSEAVDVVAHSTGGLLVKKLAVENPGSHHIGKAIFVGVPNTGAPKALKALFAGDNFGVVPLSDREMKKLARNFPVVYDLLPSREYYRNAGSYMKTIDKRLFRNTVTNLSYDQVHDLLIDDDHNLNSLALANSEALHTSDFDNFDMRTAGVDLYAIDGCKAYTPFGVTEVRNHTTGDIWYTMSTVKGGDGTVPLASSTNLPIDAGHKYYARKASHAEMMGQDGIRQQIVNILAGSELSVSASDITQDISSCDLHGRAFAVYSPVDISVTDNEGNYARISSDGDGVENTIVNSGYEVWGDHKFVYLPTDEGQTYTISLDGTGDGVFTITDADIENGEISGMRVYTRIPVTTNLLGTLSFSNSMSLDTNGDGIVDETLSPDRTLTGSEAQDFDPSYVPEDDSTLPPTASGGGGHPPIVQKLDEPEKIIELSEVVNEETTESVKIALNTEKNEVKNAESVSAQNSDGVIPIENALTASVGSSGLNQNTKVLLASIAGVLLVGYFVGRNKIL